MAEDPTDLLKRRFEFESWADPKPRDGNVCVWRFDAAHAPMDGLALHHASTAAVAARRQAKQNQGLVRATDSLWIDPERTDVLFHLNTFECESRAAARRQLLGVLGEFQGPIVERDDFAGEVGFSVRRKTVGIIAVGNLVVLLRNGGARLAAVNAVLGRFDRAMQAPFKGDGKKISMKAGKTRLPVGGRTFLDLDPPDGVSIRFVAEGGEVRIEKDRPVYDLHVAGSHRIRVIGFRGGKIIGAGSVTVEAK